jgi:hypothetical protein
MSFLMPRGAMLRNLMMKNPDASRAVTGTAMSTKYTGLDPYKKTSSMDLESRSGGGKRRKSKVSRRGKSYPYLGGDGRTV